MAKKDELQKVEVKKHVGAIHINNQLTLTQRKASNVLLANAYNELLTKDVHSIRLRLLADAIGSDTTNNYEPLKDALRALAEAKLEWNILDEEGKKEWGIAPMLAQAIIKEGRLYYAYPPVLKEKFYNPEIYANINLSVQRRISTGYSLALYENCYRFKKVGSTGWLDLVQVKRLLGVPDNDYYTDFKQLNAKIIKPSIKQVNSTSDIQLAVCMTKEGKRVVALKFNISINPNIELPFETPLKDITPDIESKAADDQLLRRLLNYGISKKHAEMFHKRIPAESLLKKLNELDKKYEAGSIKENLQGYIFSALVALMNMPSIPSPQHLIEEKNEKKKVERSKVEQKELELKARKLRERAVIENTFNSLSKKEKDALRNHFIEENSWNSLFMGAYKEKGVEGPVTQIMFIEYLEKELFPNGVIL